MVMADREKISLLFKRIQLSFAELFFSVRLLHQECKDLDLLKDYFRARVSHLKQSNA